MSILLVVLGILSFLGAGWYKIRTRIGKAEAKAAAKAAEAEAAKVEAEAAKGEAAVASAERTVIVEAMNDAQAGVIDAREVTRAASAATDHPDRAAARARAELLSEAPASDDR